MCIRLRRFSVQYWSQHVFTIPRNVESVVNVADLVGAFDSCRNLDRELSGSGIFSLQSQANITSKLDIYTPKKETRSHAIGLPVFLSYSAGQESLKPVLKFCDLPKTGQAIHIMYLSFLQQE